MLSRDNTRPEGERLLSMLGNSRQRAVAMRILYNRPDIVNPDGK